VPAFGNRWMNWVCMLSIMPCKYSRRRASFRARIARVFELAGFQVTSFSLASAATLRSSPLRDHADGADDAAVVRVNLVWWRMQHSRRRSRYRSMEATMRFFFSSGSLHFPVNFLRRSTPPPGELT